MSSVLRSQIQEDMKNAMREHDASRLGTIRLLLAAIKQREVDERITLDDNQIISVLDKMVSQRRDSIEQYVKGNRQDLADRESAEIAVLKKYLPESLSDSEVEEMIKDAIASTGASSIKDMSKVMSIIKPKAQGRADMAKIGAIIKSKLGMP